MTVAHILKQKGTAVHTANARDKVQDLVGALAKHHIGAVVVVNSSGGIEGIVSERDIVRAMAGGGAGIMSKTAADIMTRAVKTCTPLDSEADLMSMMTEHRIRHLPVAVEGKLAGMISIGDVVKHRMEMMEQEAQELKTYIASAG